MGEGAMRRSIQQVLLALPAELLTLLAPLREHPIEIFPVGDPLPRLVRAAGFVEAAVALLGALEDLSAAERADQAVVHLDQRRRTLRVDVHLHALARLALQHPVERFEPRGAE